MRVKLIRQDSRYVVTDGGDVYFAERGNMIQPFLTQKRYHLVKLGKHHSYSLHRIVAEAFVHNFDPDNLDQVNHIDGNKLNNHYTNLEWVDNSGNQVHAFKLGLNNPTRGEDNTNAKLNDELVRSACKLFEKGVGPTIAARALGVYELRSSLARVKGRQNWKHISVDYNF